jgi:hypothetical protein
MPLRVGGSTRNSAALLWEEPEASYASTPARAFLGIARAGEPIRGAATKP